MKEKMPTFKNFSSENHRYTKKDSELNPSTITNPADPFAFSIHTFRSYKNIQSRDIQESIDCINNLSLALQDQPQKNSMKCHKVFKRGDSEFSLPKFSSIQSGQTSINNSIFQDQNVAINEKSRYECDDQYSFNGDQTERDSLAPKNTENKSKYENIIQKIDNFLVKDFNQESFDQLQSCTKNKQQKSVNESKKGGDFKKHQRQRSQKFTQILEEESTVRQKLDFLSTYAESLEQENRKLKSQISQNLNIEKKVQSLQKQLAEKNILVEFLTKQLEKKYQKKQNDEKSNKQNKISGLNVQKQRNTVSAVNIMAKVENNPPKYRASHHVETKNQQINQIRQQKYQKKQLSQGISGDSCHSKSKSNSFMKKIFRRSHENNQNQNNQNSSFKHRNPDEQSYLIEILKEENSILSAKLNILYEDFQQMIDKYNQVLTEKNICKAQCCKRIKPQNEQSHYENLLQNSQQNGQIQNLQSPEDENIQKFNQIRSILGQITNHQDKPGYISQYENFLTSAQINQYDEAEQDLFSKKDLERLRVLSRQDMRGKDQFIDENQPKYVHFERASLIKRAQKNIAQFDQIQKSFKSRQSNRFSMQAPQNLSHQNGQRFSVYVNNTAQNLIGNGNPNHNNDLRAQQRSRIAPKQSNRENFRQKMNNRVVK